MSDLYRACELDTVINFFAKQSMYNIIVNIDLFFIWNNTRLSSITAGVGFLWKLWIQIDILHYWMYNVHICFLVLYLQFQINLLRPSRFVVNMNKMLTSLGNLLKMYKEFIRLYSGAKINPVLLIGIKEKITFIIFQVPLY